MGMYSWLLSIPPDGLSPYFPDVCSCYPWLANAVFGNEPERPALPPVQQFFQYAAGKWSHLIAKHAHKKIGNVIDNDHDRACSYPGKQVKASPPVGESELSNRVNFWQQCVLPPAPQPDGESNAIHEGNKSIESLVQRLDEVR